MSTPLATILIAASLSTSWGDEAAGAAHQGTDRPRHHDGQIDHVKLLPESPQPVDPLAQARIPATLDLRNMASWCLNYLTRSITAEKNFASSYGNWPLNDPPFSIGGDRIAVGGTDREISANFDRQASATNSVLFLGLSPPKVNKTVSCFVLFRRGATHSGIVFLV
jgi:hypothetical protein